MGSDEDFLQHFQPPYDPVKAHEYYLRTRQLKGRQAGLHPATAAGKGAAKAVLTKAGTKAAPKPKTPEQHRKEVEAKVKALKTELQRLHSILRRLINQAQGRIVVDAQGKPVGNTTKKASGGSSAGSSKLTAAQKRDAAKRSKDYYQKHKKELSPSDQEKQLKQQIHEVAVKIEKARSDLKASVARARQKVDNANRRQ